MSLKPVEKQSFSVLRDLILSPEKKKIQSLENRLDNPMERAKEISQALPEAIALSVTKGDKLSQVIQPVIDDALTASVKKNPKAIADAIFPALGPGIRKAISATIMTMIQSLNHLLNSSFSLQGLKWRFEALRTGRPFAEIVLLHTLVYQVEQIFLIHRDTGIVLEHVVADNVIIQDPDLVSGMLTAIQDFVKDSFETDAEDEIEALRIGSNRNVWIEKGPHAFIAAVIKGTPPLELRSNYRELVETIHLKAGFSLSNFNGDPFPFAIFRQALKENLVFREKKEKPKISPLLWAVLLVVLGVTGFWAYDLYRDHQAWKSYITRLGHEKGIILVSAQKAQGKYQVKGLADPLAPDPETLMTEQAKERLTIQTQWSAFYSLDPGFVLKRANRILTPPPEVSLALSGTTLIASGKTSQAWIRSFKNKAAAIPGVDRYDQSALVNLDRKNLDQACQDLEKRHLYFKTNAPVPIKGQAEVFSQITKEVARIRALKARAGQDVQIIIFGHTDSSGTERRNQKLSRDRAEFVLNYLILQGINPEGITLSGISAQSPLKNEDKIEDRQYNRAVSFKTHYSSQALEPDPKNGGLKAPTASGLKHD